MKKILKISILAALVCIISSCAGRDGRNGRDGRDCEFTSIPIYVPQEAWVYTDFRAPENNNNFFYATVDMPEISQAICNRGVVKMYRVGADNEVDSQMEMPYVRPAEYYNETDGNWYFYTESVDYKFTPGKITIFYRASDFDYEINYYSPEAMNFRCVILY